MRRVPVSQPRRACDRDSGGRAAAPSLGSSTRLPSQGAGGVELPGALARKYPDADREWGWQWVFPATRIYVGQRPPSARIRSPEGREGCGPCGRNHQWSTLTSSTGVRPVSGARPTGCSCHDLEGPRSQIGRGPRRWYLAVPRCIAGEKRPALARNLAESQRSSGSAKLRRPWYTEQRRRVTQFRIDRVRRPSMG